MTSLLLVLLVMVTVGYLVIEIGLPLVAERHRAADRRRQRRQLESETQAAELAVHQIAAAAQAEMVRLLRQHGRPGRRP